MLKKFLFSSIAHFDLVDMSSVIYCIEFIEKHLGFLCKQYGDRTKFI